MIKEVKEKIIDDVQIRDVLECIDKRYMYKNRYKPVYFYKTDNRMWLKEGKEYVCEHIELDWTGLKMNIIPIEKAIEYKRGLVNAQNIRDMIVAELNKTRNEEEMRKKNYLSEKEQLNIIHELFNRPVFYAIGYWSEDYKPIWGIKNEHKNYYNNKGIRMRFFFCIDDCEHCQYWNNECNNVVSDRYGKTNIINGCEDCKEMI